MKRSPSTPVRALLAALLVGTALSFSPPARAVDFDDATIPELEAAMAAGKLTSEQLVQLCLARIDAFDKKGPKLHAVLALNPKALETARALDAERKAGKVRSPLHGIPVVLKDNYNTMDLPTTGGLVLLEGSVPKADAYMVKRLRDAGAIILAKVNMSEFASASSHSSLGGQSLNPHDLARQPSGSSGGTGVSIAAGYAPLGFGTDTGGSIRGPSTANGVVGLKPTHGLLSRAGIIPLALSFDTGGPLARNVADIAAALGTMTGVDPADDATKKSQGKFLTDYSKSLNAGALKGARIGVAREFMGQDQDVDWVIESSIDQMKKAGATIVDVHYPRWVLAVKEETYNLVRQAEFPPQIKEYLATIGPQYLKSIEEMIDRAEKFNGVRTDGAGPNPSRWALFKTERDAGPLTSAKYISARDYVLPGIRVAVEGVFAENKLDAIVYPTSANRTPLIASDRGQSGRFTAAPGSIGIGGATDLANLTGFPDLIVPAGFTGEDLPVGISFLGTAFSESKLLGLGYSFEKATHARRRPVNTPALSNDDVPVQAGG